MTKEQLDFFTEQTERAIHKAVTKVVKRASIGFTVLFLAFLANTVYTQHVGRKGRDAVVNSGKAIAVDGCNRDFRDRLAVRGVLTASKAFNEQNRKAGRLTLDEFQRRRDFYDSQLAELPLPDCREELHVLTSDPTKRVAIPTPLWVDSQGDIRGVTP